MSIRHRTFVRLAATAVLPTRASMHLGASARPSRNHRSRNSIVASAAFALSAAAFVPAADANLLIDPTGGTTLNAFLVPGAFVDTSVARSLGGSFDLYGAVYTSLDVHLNGFLSGNATRGAGDRSIGSLASLVSSAVVAGLYDDTALGPNSTVSDVVSANHYYAVTYDAIFEAANVSGRTSNTFQIALFTGNTTIGGFDFLTGDIALSYGALEDGIAAGSATVGVAASLAQFTPLPGTTDGQISSLSRLPGGESFVLFRPGAGNASYGASVASLPAIASIPEPSDVALLGVGSLGLFAGVRRRKVPARR